MPIMVYDFPNFGVGIKSLGSFPSVDALIQPGTTSHLYGNWWQKVVDIGFSFPFFNHSHKFITITSKGYAMLGRYHFADEKNIQPDAPDYSPGGAGFPLNRAVISFYHTSGLAVLTSDTMTQTTGTVFIKSIHTRTLPPVGDSYTSIRSVPPTLENLLVNSDISPADGRRFVILNSRLVDQSGFQVRMATILCESGKIEHRYYHLTSYNDNAYYYDTNNDEFVSPPVSVGIQSGLGDFISLPSLSQVSIEDSHDHWVGKSVTFNPVP
jgi:hypothetical protein